MKTVFDAQSVIHIWANRSQETARTSSHNVYFEGNTLYSYGSHYPMGKHDGDVTFINCSSSTVTTNKHMGWVHQATRHLNTVYVPLEAIKAIGYNADLMRAIDEWLSYKLVNAAQSAAKRRKASLIDSDIASAMRCYNEAQKTLTRFNLKMPKGLAAMAEKLQSDFKSVVAADEKRIAADKRKREREALARQKEQLAQAQEALPLWLAGDSSYKVASHLRYHKSAYLRVNGEEIETSHGARFPLAHGKLAFAIVRKLKESGTAWKREETTGQTLTLGHYRIDSIDAQGNVKAGCHYVPWQAIEHVARVLKIFP